MKNKLFTKEEKDAIEKVLDMGFAISNSAEYVLVSEFGDHKIYNRLISWDCKDYSNLSTALTRFIKLESKYQNGEL